MLCSSESTDVLHVHVDNWMKLPGYACVQYYTVEWLALGATELPRASLASRLQEVLFAWLDCYACPAMVSSCVQDPSNIGSDSFMPAYCPEHSHTLHQIHQQDTSSAFNGFTA